MTTTTNHSNKRSNSKKRGYTLIEIMVSMSIMSLVLTGVTSSFTFLTKTALGLGNYVIMNQDSRVGLELLSRDIRMASDINFMDDDNLTITVPVGGGGTTVIDYSYEAEQGLVNREEGGETTTILKDIEDFDFNYYTFLSVETANILEVKEVQVEAKMVKEIYNMENTSHLISARYLMRNKIVNN